MAQPQKIPGWAFWARWLLASAVGFGAGAFLGMCLAWATVGVVTTDGAWTPEFFSTAYLADSVNATAVRRSAIFAPGGEFMLWTAAVVVGGFMQWLVVRQQPRWAHWWALPVPLFVGFIGLTDPDRFFVGGGLPLLAYHAKDFALGGLVFGTIVGTPLVLLLRRRSRQSAT